MPDSVYDDIQRMMPEFVATKQFIEKCIRCGSELQDELAEAQGQIDYLQRVKEEFFPGRS